MRGMRDAIEATPTMAPERAPGHPRAYAWATKKLPSRLTPRMALEVVPRRLQGRRGPEDAGHDRHPLGLARGRHEVVDGPRVPDVRDAGLVGVPAAGAPRPAPNGSARMSAMTRRRVHGSLASRRAMASPMPWAAPTTTVVPAPAICRHPCRSPPAPPRRLGGGRFRDAEEPIIHMNPRRPSRHSHRGQPACLSVPGTAPRRASDPGSSCPREPRRDARRHRGRAGHAGPAPRPRRPATQRRGHGRRGPRGREAAAAARQDPQDAGGRSHAAGGGRRRAPGGQGRRGRGPPAVGRDGPPHRSPRRGRSQDRPSDAPCRARPGRGERRQPRGRRAHRPGGDHRAAWPLAPSCSRSTPASRARGAARPARRRAWRSAWRTCGAPPSTAS